MEGEELRQQRCSSQHVSTYNARSVCTYQVGYVLLMYVLRVVRYANGSISIQNLKESHLIVLH